MAHINPLPFLAGFAQPIMPLSPSPPLLPPHWCTTPLARVGKHLQVLPSAQVPGTPAECNQLRLVVPWVKGMAVVHVVMPGHMHSCHRAAQ
jgi:hypothetical protein